MRARETQASRRIRGGSSERAPAMTNSNLYILSCSEVTHGTVGTFQRKRCVGRLNGRYAWEKVWCTSSIRGSHRKDAEDPRLLEHDAASLGGWFATLRSIKLPSSRVNGPDRIHLGLLAVQDEGNTIFRNVGTTHPTTQRHIADVDPRLPHVCTQTVQRITETE